MPYADKQKNLEATQNWKKRHPDRVRQYSDTHREKVRNLIFDHYGRVCVCCGEDEIIFLSIDHIDGGGNHHRREVGSGSEMYQWLVNTNFPEGFQVLCYNCQMGKYKNGVCPHAR